MEHTAEFADRLAAYGIDYADAMDRFGGNGTLFERLALKYLSDDHFAGLTAAMMVDDYDEAYRQAHALKGVAGNLSLADLFREASEVCEALRNGELGLAKARLGAVEKAHAQALRGLERLEAGTL